MARSVTISVACADVTSFPADVLVLKYAHGLHGADEVVYDHLTAANIGVKLPAEGQWEAITAGGSVAPGQVIFMGVVPLYQFEYPQIRQFARNAVAVVAAEAPEARHMALTLHGPGYGLDEMEAFDAEVAGLLDGLRLRRVPPQLIRITFVEFSPKRAERLTARLKILLPKNQVSLDASGQPERLSEESRETVRSAGSATEKKPRIFVAMPFDEGMNDVYDYGIFKPAHEIGFVCERADREIFTDDIVHWVKDRIASADIVVADLTGANANVYLEIGYAWGLQKRILLVVRHPEEPRFNLKTQRCFIYKSIRNLEEQLKPAFVAFRPA